MMSEVDSGRMAASDEPCISDIKARLAQKEKDLQLAAEIGKQLLDTNNELSCQLESATSQMAAKMEALEQEKHELQMRLEQRARMELNYTEEISNLKTMLKRQKQEHENAVEMEHQAKLAQLTKLSTAQCDMEQAVLAEKQMTIKCKELEEMVRTLQEQISTQVTVLNETCSDEVATLNSDLNSLQTEKMSLQKELHEYRALTKLEMEGLQRRLASSLEEVEEVQRQATSYYNTLEKSREEVQELKVELDLLKMESQNQKAKGNSLFSEVEDRRIEAEKELITLKVQNECLQRQFDISKQQLHNLKVQLVGFLHMSSGQAANTHYLQSLQQQLVRARGDIEHLTAQLHNSQQETAKEELSKMEKSSMGGADTNFVNYLKAQIKMKEKQMEAVQKELQTKRLVLLSESQKIIDMEQKLYNSEKALEAMTAQFMKSKMRVDELTLKYEPSKIKTKPAKKVFVEKIPMEPPEGDRHVTNLPEESTEEENKENLSSSPSNIEKVQDIENSRVTGMLKDTSKLKIATCTVEANPSSLVPKSIIPTTAMKPVLKSIKVKKVSLSDDVDIIESEECSDDIGGSGDTGGQTENELTKLKGRVRGRQRHQGSVKVSDMNHDCKTQ